MIKKGFTIALVIVGFGLLWYFLIKPQDYQVRVETKSIPGVINQSLKAWNNTLENASIQQIDNIKHLKQTIQVGDSTHVYTWNISSITDSTSFIKVDVKDISHSVMNRLMIPFSDTDFEKNSRKVVTDFIKSLNVHRKEFKIAIVDQEELPSTYCACVEHKTSLSKKAFGMMDSFPFLNSVILNNNLQLNGVPFIETTLWDIDKDNIEFNFCYPIIRTDSLPFIKDIIYKEFIGKKSLKAIYNGNYMTSDRAWYALLDYAERNNIEIEQTPIEFFFNNPTLGGDALRWKAEVFMPIKKKDD